MKSAVGSIPPGLWPPHLRFGDLCPPARAARVALSALVWCATRDSDASSVTIRRYSETFIYLSLLHVP